MSKAPIKVVVSGAAGNIGYAIVPRLLKKYLVWTNLLFYVCGNSTCIANIEWCCYGIERLCICMQCRLRLHLLILTKQCKMQML